MVFLEEKDEGKMETCSWFSWERQPSPGSRKKDVSHKENSGLIRRRDRFIPSLDVCVLVFKCPRLTCVNGNLLGFPPHRNSFKLLWYFVSMQHVDEVPPYRGRETFFGE